MNTSRALAALLASVAALPAFAQSTYDWSGAANGDLSGTPANWGGTVPTSSDTARWNASTYSNTPTADADIVFGKLLFDAGNTAGITFGSGASTITLNGIAGIGIELKNGSGAVNTGSANFALGAAQAWTNNSGNLLTVGGAISNGGFGLTVNGTGSTALGGIISGTGGISKSGTGTLTLSQANTYSGATNISGGTVSVDTVGTTGASSNLGSNGTIHIGATTTAGTLIYTGTGETSNKVINLAGTTAGATITQSGASGNLLFTSNLTATGLGAKTLTLNGSTAGTAEISGAIVDSTGFATAVTKTGTGTWTLSGANTYSGLTNLNGANGTLIMSGSNSSAGATTAQSGTLALNSASNGGLASGLLTLGSGGSIQVLTAANLSNTVTLSNGSGGFGINGAQSLTFNGDVTFVGNSGKGFVNNLTGGAILTLNGAFFNLSNSGTNNYLSSGSGSTVINSVIQTGAVGTAGSLTHSGGTLTLNGLNTYSGVTTIAGRVNVFNVGNTGSSSNLGSNGTINLGLGSNGTSPNGTGTLVYTGTGETSDKVINLSGGTNGAVIDQSGTSALKFTSDLTATGVGAKTLTLQGSTSGTGQIAGAIIDNDGANFTRVAKSGTGTWTLSGNNSYTGSTTLNAGTLKLDYSTNNTSKLSNTATNGTLLLNGGTLELAGGSHVETVLSTTLNTGSTSIKRTSGTSTLSMGAITFTGGAIDFGSSNIATTSSANTNGILSQRATVAGADFAANDGSGNIVAYTGYTTFAGTMTANTNYLTTGGHTLASSVGAATNTLKIAPATTGQSLSVGTNTLTVGAILFTGANDYAITTSGAGKINNTTNVPIVHNHGTGTLSLGALGGGLIQYGSGKTVLTAAATTDSALTIHGGAVQISSNAQIGTNATVKAITLNNGTLIADTTSGNIALDNAGTFSRTVAIGNGGGTIDVIGGNTLTISGVISGAAGTGPLTFGSSNSNGTVNLTAVNTYTGATILRGGTVSLGAADRIADTSALVMAGGTFETRGFSERLGTLTLSASSIIDLGAGASSLVFDDSRNTTWGTSISLSFVNFTNGVDSIRIGATSGGLTSAQLAQITINGMAATIDSSGFLTSAIPEPSTFALLAGAGALLAVVGRRTRRST